MKNATEALKDILDSELEGKTVQIGHPDLTDFNLVDFPAIFVSPIIEEWHETEIAEDLDEVVLTFEINAVCRYFQVGSEEEAIKEVISFVDEINTALSTNRKLNNTVDGKYKKYDVSYGIYLANVKNAFHATAKINISYFKQVERTYQLNGE
jgi:hypothetical protein